MGFHRKLTRPEQLPLLIINALLKVKAVKAACALPALGALVWSFHGLNIVLFEPWEFLPLEKILELV